MSGSSSAAGGGGGGGGGGGAEGGCISVTSVPVVDDEELTALKKELTATPRSQLSKRAIEVGVLQQDIDNWLDEILSKDSFIDKVAKAILTLEDKEEEDECWYDVQVAGESRQDRLHLDNLAAIYPFHLSFEEDIVPGQTGRDPNEALASLERSIGQFPDMIRLLPLLAEHGGCISGDFVTSALLGTKADVDIVDVWVPAGRGTTKSNHCASMIMHALTDSKTAHKLDSFSVYFENTSHVEAASRGRKFVNRVKSIYNFEISSSNNICTPPLPLFFHPFTIDYKEFKSYGRRFCDTCDTDTSKPFNMKTCPNCACSWIPLKDMIYKVLKQVHPCTGMDKEAKRFLCDILDRMFHRIVFIAFKSSPEYVKYKYDRELDPGNIISRILVAVDVVIGRELAKHAKSEIGKALTKLGCNPTSTPTSEDMLLDECTYFTSETYYRTISKEVRSKAGLQFDPEIFLHRKIHGENMVEAAVALAACAEYMSAEVLELSGNAARDNKKCRITSSHIMLAISNDEELNELVRSLSANSSDFQFTKKDFNEFIKSTSSEAVETPKKSMKLQVFELANNLKGPVGGSVFESAINSYDLTCCCTGITVDKQKDGSFSLKVKGSGVRDALCRIGKLSEYYKSALNKVEYRGVPLSRIQMLLQGRANCGVLFNSKENDLAVLMKKGLLSPPVPNSVKKSINISKALCVMQILVQKIVHLDVDYTYLLIQTMMLEEGNGVWYDDA